MSLLIFYVTFFFFCIRPPPELLPELGLLERYMRPTLDAALLLRNGLSCKIIVLCFTFYFSVPHQTHDYSNEYRALDLHCPNKPARISGPQQLCYTTTTWQSTRNRKHSAPSAETCPAHGRPTIIKAHHNHIKRRVGQGYAHHNFFSAR